MCVCMYICNVCMYVRTHTYVCMHAFLSVCLSVCMYVCMFAFEPLNYTGLLSMGQEIFLGSLGA